MNKKRLFISLFVGSVFAGLTVLLIRFPVLVGPIAYLLFPGAILGIMVSGNVHLFSPWVFALGNFAFYFGLSYLVVLLWERHTRTVDASKAN